MKAPIEWLKQYVKLADTPDRLAEKLTMAGVEVSAIEYHGKNISDVVVGKIKSIEKHATKPDILICQVDTGIKMLQIVTKAQNVKVGDKVPVALHGATLPSGIKIEKRELHGVESFGMLCSTVELGLSNDAMGIMILEKDTAVGEDIKKVLGIGGAVLEIDVLPNRIDILSIIGMARELGAVLNKKITYPSIKLKETTELASGSAKVIVKDKDLCPRYMARVIKEVKIGASPKWIEERLIACGMRPINNIVDVTNYVLLEMGQPLHAFDLNLLNERTIIVRRAKKGEKIATLDGEKRELNESILVIGDSTKAVAVAGVMGGMDSEVIGSTKDILLESAYFEPTSINKTEKQLKIRTEASMRFDRGVDWDMVETALDRAAALIAETSGGKVLKGTFDVCAKQRKPKQIVVRLNRVNQILGTKIKAAEFKSILTRLGFMLKGNKVNVPLFRAGDVEREIDVIEEVARIYGYGNIPITLPTLKLESSEVLSEKQLGRIRDMMVDAGLYEANTYSMLPEKTIASFDLGQKEKIKLLNPISDELSVMRTSLIPSLLEALSYNLNRQITDVNIFEIGKSYSKSGNKIDERLMLGAVLCGNRIYAYNGTGQATDIYQIKTIIGDILDLLGVKFELKPSDMASLNPGRSASIFKDSRLIGVFGELHPSIMSKLGVNKPILIISLDLNDILGVKKLPKIYKEIPQYPASSRDIAMMVPSGVSNKAIIDEIKNIGGSLVESVKLFDMYKGKQVEEGYYSLAYSITYRDTSKTLKDDVINAKHSEITDNLAKKLGIKVRK